jgi:very-short-patch-repair endonuclease
MPTDPGALAFGAMLAAGEDSAIAGRSAGAFYGALRHWPETFELVSPHQRRITGLTVHRASTLAGRDVWRFDGLRVTSPARTALDLAPRLSPERLPAVVDHLRLRPRDKLTISALEDVVARNPRHPGVGPLEMVLVQAGCRPRRSKLERSGWPAFAAAQNLPPYEQNVMVGGHEVDVLVDGLVAVEIDTVATHLLTFESDRRRDAEILARTGIPVIRVTDTQLEEQPERAARNIIATVERRRAEVGRPPAG